MAKKDKRIFSVEFKREVLASAEQGQKIADLARLHGLTVNTIYSWRRQLRDQELDAAVERAPRVQHSGINPKYVRSLEEHLREANEKLGELYIVVEGLKKTSPAFTKSASSFIVSGSPWGQLKRRAK